MDKNSVRYEISSLFLLMLATNVAAVDVCGMGQSEMNATREDGTRVHLAIEGSKLKETPPWHVIKDDPPLSVRAASSLAMNWAGQKYKGFESVRINAITIKSLACGEEFTYWYYVFDFSMMKNGERSHDVGNWLVVLMDGSVVEPTID